MNVQEKYWEDLVQLKFQMYYLEEYISDSYKKDNYINMILAIASSSSIAAWAVWKELVFIWSIIIASSQVINAIKIYLPYNKRKKYLNKFSSELTDLFNEYDYKWLKVERGELSLEKINELIYEMRKKRLKIENKYLLNDYLPIKKAFIEKADDRLEDYFKKYQ